jgi:hypothetical protein
LALRAVVATVVAGVISLATMVGLSVIKAHRSGKSLELPTHLAPFLAPRATGDWVTVAGIVAVAVTVGLATAATLAARRGVAPAPE